MSPLVDQNVLGFQIMVNYSEVMEVLKSDNLKFTDQLDIEKTTAKDTHDFGNNERQSVVTDETLVII